MTTLHAYSIFTPMHRTRLLFALGLSAAAVTAGCNDSSGPSNGTPYGWRVGVSDGAGGIDSLAFHWQGSDLPVSIWVEDQYDMRSHFETAVERWGEVLDDDEFRAQFVADSADADIIVRVAQPVGEAKVERLHAFSAACEGGTDIVIADGHEHVMVPMHLYVIPRFDPTASETIGCFAVTSAHELGHALGLFQHSPDQSDVMYAEPLSSHPSPRDAATVRLLYSQPADLTPLRQ